MTNENDGWVRISLRMWLWYIALIGIAILITHLLQSSPWKRSAVFYFAWPALISLVILPFFKAIGPKSKATRFFDHFVWSSIIFASASALLKEGFICIILFIPIYFISVSIGYIARWLFLKIAGETHGSKLHAAFLPGLILLAALEGTTPALSFERHNQVTQTMIVKATPEQLLANMARPIDLRQTNRPWFIAMFPMPEQVEAGSLKAGDVHRLPFIYRKWFVTNFHHGEMLLRIESVGPDHVVTRVVKNTSYLSGFLRIEGTEVGLKDMGNGQTRISLTIDYERRLDPAWYFAPLQRLAVTQSARYLISNVIAREYGHG